MLDRIEAKLDRLLSTQPTPFDVTWAQAQALNARLLTPDKARDAFQAIVRGLDDSGDSPSSPAEVEIAPGAEPPSRLRPPSPRQQWQEPRRRTHGGPMGPKVREKLMREALGD